MEVEIINIDKECNKLSFLLKGSEPYFANAMRRCAIDEVPTMAIEDVELRKNSSALYDENVAHRLGLIPLTTDLKSYVPIDNCKCEGEGCARCTVTMSLKTDGPCIVYASEIKSNDPKVKPVFPEMPITKLLKGQKLEIEMRAVLGRGRVHMKWSPGLVYYRYKPEVKMGNVANAEEIARKCPPDLFEVKGGTLVVNEKALMKHDLAGLAEKISGGAVHIEENPAEFVFHVESWGQLNCKEIMERAAEELQGQIKEFERLIKGK